MKIFNGKVTRILKNSIEAFYVKPADRLGSIDHVLSDSGGVGD